ncbi:GGDEF domain-containing protein [Pseudoxanthomonas wuyuanensis]|uniref:diguanylate cyclase n=1 Tax=Pseudoxanthomonas wuyuanensis TaxID=1073196 RepID=A0A286D896_9GAMM|nr:GGDEF domain-containing protein [Pseudoxanthomonas wuyuanensis]KAF1718847.1 GGDEF domain-containing protein [Pseudoxanthomonas wuyuanensis]SOD54863.1 diguanylate cyclase (GGDEF) domain-containing protein [Pseudoxanthomonas wuyuanensis]
MESEKAARVAGYELAGPATDGVSRETAVAVLSAEECALFAEAGRARTALAGERLFSRGEHGTSMFVILRGAVILDFGDDLSSKALGPGEFFGELGLLVGDHLRSAMATVSADSELLELRYEEFQSLVDRDAALVSHFLRRAIMRVVLNEQNLIHRLRCRNQELQAALDSLRITSHRLNQSEELNRTDELTELYNRRGLALYLEQRRNNGGFDGFGLLLVDCDHFKNVNDAYGHLLGDRVLQSVANIMRSLAGTQDLACRLGGDEFCLLLKAADRDEMLRYADFVVSTAHALQQMHPSPPLICSLSVGACLIDPTRDWNDWYAQADKALYRAKHAGGNRVEWQD